MSKIGITTTLNLRASDSDSLMHVGWSGDIYSQGDAEFKVTIEENLTLPWAATEAEIQKAVVDAFVAAAAVAGYPIGKHDIYYSAPIQ